MNYTTVYDLTAIPVISIKSLVIPFGLSVAALVCAYFARTKKEKWFLYAFAALVILLPTCIPYWDYYQLSQQQTLKVSGKLTGYWKRDWTERKHGKNYRYSYEGFSVNNISFGYFKNVELASFTNREPFEINLQDGIQVQITYAPERQLDDGSISNRIIKFEVVQPVFVSSN